MVNRDIKDVLPRERGTAKTSETRGHGSVAGKGLLYFRNPPSACRTESAGLPCPIPGVSWGLPGQK